ncbi:hypothetical protein K435DRAFT_856046 [Dendrothele bispora CBS 962.96]|uniref:KOW domain-containing protein n=1 Tax=Dendrothele bispora (strain CBS 962.96) TaxID=1314807 RepID=A0A4S8MA71_DENBC|nr:hypothetical protein K435DRAFT_856046 [Dendrothele bispora CBS 962.96]
MTNGSDKTERYRSCWSLCHRDWVQTRPLQIDGLPVGLVTRVLTPSHALPSSFFPSPPPALPPSPLCYIVLLVLAHMVNPFIDDRAYHDRDHSDSGEEDGAGGGDGTEFEEEEEYLVNRNTVPDWLDEDLLDSSGVDAQDFIDHLEQRYVKKPQKSSPILNEILDNELETSTLKQMLLAMETPQSFWRIRCQPGQETQLAFDILQHELERHVTQEEGPTIVVSTADPSHIPTEVPFEKAIQCIRKFSQTPSTTIQEVLEDVSSILGEDPLPEIWRNAIDKAVTEPDEEPSAGLKRFEETVPALTASRPVPPSDVCIPPHPPHLPDPTLPMITAAEDEILFRALSAFVPPNSVGSVYLEGYLGKDPQHSAIIEFLRGHYAVRKCGFLRDDHVVGVHKRRVSIDSVSRMEIAQLLTSSPASIKPFSWIRVKKGTYADNVGLVIRREISTGQRRLVVLLVPRLAPVPICLAERPVHPNHPLRDVDSSARESVSSRENQTVRSTRKRKRSEWFTQTLFNPLKNVGECQEIADHRFRTPRGEFDHGLLVACLPINWVTDVDVSMDYETRRSFITSKHPVLNSVHLPACSNWRFFVKEEVEVIHSAPLTIAHVIHPELSQTETCRKEGFKDYIDYDSEDTSVWIDNKNVRKRFRIGDMVLVLTGEYQERAGMVITTQENGIVLAKTGVRKGQTFSVDPNVCRLTMARDSSITPWIRRHVTICRGQYKRYTGLVVDVLPPQPYTLLDVQVPQLLQTVRVKHDDVLDTYVNKPLFQAFPLSEGQQYFKQQTWDLSLAPNLKDAPVDPHTKQTVMPEDMIKGQPRQPWIDEAVLVVKGTIKTSGTVKEVQRSHHLPRTGLPLHIRHPLHGRMRYWEPLVRVKAVSIPNPKIAHSWTRPIWTSNTPPWSNQDFVDPFQTAGAGPSFTSSAPPPPPTHWILDPRLDEKEFYVRWKPNNGPEMSKVIAKPECCFGRVRLTHGADSWIMPAEEIYDVAVPILPKTNKLPLVVVRGEHTGKHLRQFFCKYWPNEEEARIMAVVYSNWGTTAEKRLENHIEVQAQDCAQAAYEPNKQKFKADIEQLRRDARRSDKGKTPKRPYKPKTQH